VALLVHCRIAQVNFEPNAALSFRFSERTADLGVLGLGLILGSAGAVGLIAAALGAHDTEPTVAAILIYAAALPATFLCALLLTATLGDRRRVLLRRIDHAAIFVMIAATATPFALGPPSLGWSRSAAAAVWAAAGIGIFVKLRFPIGPLYRSAAAYVLLGCFSLLAIGPAIASAEAVLLIAAGVAFYLVGLTVYLARRVRYRRAIWHVFVVLGAACHYFAVIDGVVLLR
jgi:hemolysin III